MEISNKFFLLSNNKLIEFLILCLCAKDSSCTSYTPDKYLPECWQYSRIFFYIFIWIISITLSNTVKQTYHTFTYPKTMCYPNNDDFRENLSNLNVCDALAHANKNNLFFYSILVYPIETSKVSHCFMGTFYVYCTICVHITRLQCICSTIPVLRPKWQTTCRYIMYTWHRYCMRNHSICNCLDSMCLENINARGRSVLYTIYTGTRSISDLYLESTCREGFILIWWWLWVCPVKVG